MALQPDSIHLLKNAINQLLSLLSESNHLRLLKFSIY